MTSTQTSQRPSAPKTHYFVGEFHYSKCPHDLRLPSERSLFPTSCRVFEHATYDNDAKEVEA